MTPTARLRAQLLDFSGYRCEWPQCDQPDVQLAHIEPRGMGGRRSVHTIHNTWLLCQHHHDLFDLRHHHGLARALRNLAKAYVRTLRTPLA